jgi:hypothetical protein
MVRSSLGSLLAALTTLPACSLNFGQQPLVCGDFLQEWGAKPAALRFEGCKTEKRVQSDKLVATYWVPGKDAAPVERHLVKNYRMAPLRFLCCVWENSYGPDQSGKSREGFYKDAQGRQFYISMASEETVLKDWKQIPRFGVWVETYLGEI